MTLTIDKILNKDNKPFEKIIFHHYKNKEKCNDKKCKSISIVPIHGG